MIDHQAAILDNFDSGVRQGFSCKIVSDSELHPGALRFRRDDIVQMLRNVLWAAKNIYEVDSDRHFAETAINLLSKNC